MLRGIDVSNWQGVINWDQVKADGYDFAIIKATEGAAIVDVDFAANWTGAKRVGLARGAYCFTRPELGDPAGQAAHFVQVVNLAGGWEPGDLAAGDFETPTGTADESAFALTWLGAVHTAIGFAPLLYCNEDWAANRLKDGRLAAYPLWLACLDPATLPPSIGVWHSVALQQYSFTLQIPGIAGNVDGDRISRTLDGLKALGKPAPTPPVALMWHVKATAGLKPEPTPSHSTRSIMTVFGGDVVTRTGREQDGWTEVTAVNKAGTKKTGWLVSTNLYSTRG